MSRRRNRSTSKANKSNLVGLVATVIKVDDKNKGKMVVINNVSNDIAEIILLGDKKMNKFYLPVSDLSLFSRERSQKILLENIIDGLWMDVVNAAIISDDIWRKHARGNADNAQPPKKEPRDLTDDSERNYLDHAIEGGDLLIKCSKFCRDYKISPIYFISKLSEHLYCMHERYAPKGKK